MNDEHLKRIAELLRETANEVEALICTKANEETSTPSTTEDNEKLQVILPVEEAFIETAAETGEPVAEPEKKTVEEARAIVSKALKAGLRAEAKAIVSKYGASVSEVGEKTPEKLCYLYDEISAILEAANA